MKTIFKNIIPTILLLVLSNTCFAHGLGGHNKELEQILFGNNLSKVSEKGKVHFRLLCEAAYLTLDYTSDNDSRDSGIRFATDLINNGVKQIPSLRDISFPANQYHQMYTHSLLFSPIFLNMESITFFPSFIISSYVTPDSVSYK